MLDNLLQFDILIFGLINQDLSNPFFDFLLPLFRSKFFWIPLYILVLGFLIFKLKKQSIGMILLFVITVFLTDKINSELIKKSVARTRPCNEIMLADAVIKRVECGNGFSFASSHAANHFALAQLFVLILFPLISTNKTKRYLLGVLSFFWAFSIAFAQVYVGVHYPSDVIVGALLGISLASLTYALFKILKKRVL
jgi:undecaprenyl-diphosphatase